MKKKATTRRHARATTGSFAPVSKRPVRVKRTPQQLAALRQLFGVSD